MRDEAQQARRDAQYERSQRRAELFLPVSDQVANLGVNYQGEDEDGDDPDLKVVEEIESLCMNCHEDVSWYYCVEYLLCNFH